MVSLFFTNNIHSSPEEFLPDFLRQNGSGRSFKISNVSKISSSLVFLGLKQ